jgi:hypothetical protein
MQRANRQNKASQKLQKPQKVAKRTKTTKVTAVTTATKKAQSTAFATTRPARRMAVQWSKAQSPFSKSLPQEFVNMQAQLDTMWAEVYAAPKEVTDVDFAPFDAKIKNKAALEAIKKEYGATTFTVTKSLFQSAEAAAAKVKAAESEATFMRDSAAGLKTKIEQLSALSTVIPFMSLDQQIQLTPGLDQEFDRQLSNYQQLTDQTTLKALDVDCGKISAALKSGNLPEVPAEAINRIMYTPVYFAAVKQHDEGVVKTVKAKYGLDVPSATSIIHNSLKRQNALPSIDQVNAHLEELGLSFILTSVEPSQPSEIVYSEKW